MNLYSTLTESFTKYPDRVLLECDDGRQWTCAGLEALGDSLLARAAAAGLRRGDRVLVQTRKSASVIAFYFACLRSGLVFVPLNTAYTSAELSYFIADADPKLVVIDQDETPPETDTVPVFALDASGGGSLQEPENDAAASRTTRALSAAALLDPTNGAMTETKDAGRPAQAVTDGEAPAAIIYTSGTTGRSKGAVLSHANLCANAQALVSAWDFRSTDVLLHTLPVFHVHGLFIALHTAMLAGARIRFCSTFDPLQVCNELPGCTVFMGVPTYYTRLLATPQFSRDCCRTMRLFVSGSAPLLPETFTRFEQVTGHRILERYGMSETNVIASNPLSGERVPGTVGFAVDGTEIRVADDADQTVAAGETGSIQVRGASVFNGYWRRPELAASEFTRDGFFCTGDVGQLDDEGRLTLIGRAKDLIISGGLNVYPAEIERFLDAIPGVVETAVVAAPDADFGERVEAFVVAEADAGDGLPDELRRQVRSGLANFKRPKAFHLIDALPRNTMGKVQKNALRQQLESSTSDS